MFLLQLVIHLLLLLTHSSSQDVTMVSFAPDSSDITLIQAGKTQDTTSNHPIAQHTSFLRVSAAKKADVTKMTAGLQLRALPLGADGNTNPESTQDPNTIKHTQLRIDVSKPTTEPTSVGDAYETTVEITYICGGQAGKFVVLGTIPGLQAEEVIVFQWKKTCGLGHIYGFSVTTSDDQDVVVNGDVVPSFRYNNNKNIQQESEEILKGNALLYHVLYTQDQLQLFVQGPIQKRGATTGASTDYFPPLSFNVSAIRMTPTPDKAGLGIILEGPASTGGYLERGDKIPLTFVFDCLLAGTTIVEIDFIVSNNDQLITTVVFAKECHVGPLPGFDIMPTGIESIDNLAVKDGLARPNYHAGLPMAIVDATQTSIDFEIFTARPGLSIPIKKIWATATDFEIQQDPTREDLPWLFKKNHQGSKWQTTQSTHPGRGSIFGSSGSIFDTLTNKLFTHHALPANSQDGNQRSSVLFHKFVQPGQPEKGGNGKGGNGKTRRQLWKPNVREEPAEIPFQNSNLGPRIRRSSIIAKVSVSGSATRGKGPKQDERIDGNDFYKSPRVEPHKPLTLSVLHDCTHSGSVVVTINIVILPETATIVPEEEEKEQENEKESDTPTISQLLSKFIQSKIKESWNQAKHRVVKFSYIKECLVGSIPGLDISMGTYQPTKKMGGFALFHGRVTPYFLAGGRAKMVVREAEKTSNFYLSLNNPEWKVEIQNVTARVLHRSDIVDNVEVTVLSSTGSKISMWRPHHPILLLGKREEYKAPRILSVAYSCIQTGTARIVLDLLLIPTRNGKTEPERSMTMSWDKKCRVAPLRGLMIKMLNPHYVDTIGASYLFPVVNHGQVSPKYTVDIASAGIGKRWDQITLIVSMEVNATMPIAVPFVVSNNKITAPMLEVRKRSSTASSSTLLASPTEKHHDPYGYSDDTTLYLTDQTTFSMDLKFNCQSDAYGYKKNGSSIVTVVIPLRPPVVNDISTVVEYPVDVEFAFTKRCGAVKNKNKGRNKTPTATGIVLSVVVVLGLAVCIGVICCPQVVLNMRARLFRKDYKYKRVKLEEDEGDNLDDDAKEEEEFGLKEGGNEIEMRSRRKGVPAVSV